MPQTPASARLRSEQTLSGAHLAVIRFRAHSHIGKPIARVLRRSWPPKLPMAVKSSKSSALAFRASFRLLYAPLYLENRSHYARR